MTAQRAPSQKTFRERLLPTIGEVVVGFIRYFFSGLLILLAWNIMIPIVALGAMEAGLINQVNGVNEYVGTGLALAVVMMAVRFMRPLVNSAKIGHSDPAS